MVVVPWPFSLFWSVLFFVFCCSYGCLVFFWGVTKKNTTVGIGDEMAACLGLIVQMELKDLALKGNQVV